MVKKFWQDLENMLRNKCINSARFSFSLELVIFGTSSFIKTDKVIEFIILNDLKIYLNNAKKNFGKVKEHN